MSELSKLPNIGPKIALELEEAGIHTIEALREVGSIEALIRINGTQFDEGCLNKLYALEGAIVGIRWHHLEAVRKQVIKKAYLERIGK